MRIFLMLSWMRKWLRFEIAIGPDEAKDGTDLIIIGYKYNRSAIIKPDTRSRSGLIPVQNMVLQKLEHELQSYAWRLNTWWWSLKQEREEKIGSRDDLNMCLNFLLHRFEFISTSAKFTEWWKPLWKKLSSLQDQPFEQDEAIGTFTGKKLCMVNIEKFDYVRI